MFAAGSRFSMEYPFRPLPRAKTRWCPFLYEGVANPFGNFMFLKCKAVVSQPCLHCFRHDGAANGMAAVVATPSDFQQHADAARVLDSEIVELLVCRCLLQAVGSPWHILSDVCPVPRHDGAHFCRRLCSQPFWTA